MIKLDIYVWEIPYIQRSAAVELMYDLHNTILIPDSQGKMLAKRFLTLFISRCPISLGESVSMGTDCIKNTVGKLSAFKSGLENNNWPLVFFEQFFITTKQKWHATISILCKIVDGQP